MNMSMNPEPIIISRQMKPKRNPIIIRILFITFAILLIAYFAASAQFNHVYFKPVLNKTISIKERDARFSYEFRHPMVIPEGYWISLDIHDWTKDLDFKIALTLKNESQVLINDIIDGNQLEDGRYIRFYQINKYQNSRFILKINVIDPEVSKGFDASDSSTQKSPIIVDIIPTKQLSFGKVDVVIHAREPKKIFLLMSIFKWLACLSGILAILELIKSLSFSARNEVIRSVKDTINILKNQK